MKSNLPQKCPAKKVNALIFVWMESPKGIIVMGGETDSETEVSSRKGNVWIVQINGK